MEKSKVAVVACPDYEPARVKESLQKGLEAIGGLESLIGKEENILLKPNLVRSAKRERAVVTDPEVMDALITILQENGYENISCGDSCGLGTPEGIAVDVRIQNHISRQKDNQCGKHPCIPPRKQQFCCLQHNPCHQRSKQYINKPGGKQQHPFICCKKTHAFHQNG